jgi:hypothetical protein
MSQRGGWLQSGFTAFGAALLASFLFAGCVVHHDHHHSRPTHVVLGPPVTTVHRHVHHHYDHDVTLVYDASWGGYWVRDYPDRYYHGGSYYWHRNGRWHRAERPGGPWVVCGVRSLPAALHRHHARIAREEAREVWRDAAAARREARREREEARRDAREEVREERRDAREERREDRREAREDRRDARQEVRQDRREANHERREEKRDAREDLREDRKEAREDRREDREEVREERREDRQEAREDRRDARQEARDGKREASHERREKREGKGVPANPDEDAEDNEGDDQADGDHD